jgi:hypothetical protein
MSVARSHKKQKWEAIINIVLTEKMSTTLATDKSSPNGTMTCVSPSSLQPQPQGRRVMFRRLHSSPCCLESNEKAKSDNKCNSNNTSSTFLPSTKDKETKKFPPPLPLSQLPAKSCLSLNSNSNLKESSPSPPKVATQSQLAIAASAVTVSTECPTSPLPRNKNMLKRKVSFGHIKIREHPRALGDHPSVSSGPALSLDWYSEDGNCPYSRTKELPLDEYEKERGSPRSRREIVVPRHERQQILLEEVGIPFSEMYAFQEETAMVKRSRKKSAKCRQAMMEEKVEDAASPPVVKMLRRLGQQLFSIHQNEAQEHSTERKQLDDIMIRAQAAERIRHQHDVAYWEAHKKAAMLVPELPSTTTTVAETNNPVERERGNEMSQKTNALHHSASEPFFLSLVSGYPNDALNMDPSLEF